MTGPGALVTGASSGLGRYLAAGLAAKGWTVTGTGRRALSPDGYRYVRADLSDPASADAIVAALDGTPELVVHCAASYPDPATTANASAEDLAALFAVNALTPYVLIRRLLAELPAGARFCCVVVNSEAIFAADRHSAPYAAGKAALRVLTAGLADACRGTGASVATLLLGPLAAADKLTSARAVAAKRGVSPDEIVRAFLARSNPALVIDRFIDYGACLRSVEYIAELGPTANGMLCRLDGGSAGSLI